MPSLMKDDDDASSTSSGSETTLGLGDSSSGEHPSDENKLREDCSADSKDCPPAAKTASAEDDSKEIVSRRLDGKSRVRSNSSPAFCRKRHGYVEGQGRLSDATDVVFSSTESLSEKARPSSACADVTNIKSDMSDEQESVFYTPTGKDDSGASGGADLLSKRPVKRSEKVPSKKLVDGGNARRGKSLGARSGKPRPLNEDLDNKRMPHARKPHPQEVKRGSGEESRDGKEATARDGRPSSSATIPKPDMEAIDPKAGRRLKRDPTLRRDTIISDRGQQQLLVVPSTKPTGKSRTAREGAKSSNNLLSKFITYEDQLPPIPPTPPPTRKQSAQQYKPLPQHSPNDDKRKPSLTLARQRESAGQRENAAAQPSQQQQQQQQKKASLHDGVIMCSLESNQVVSPLRSPESQRQQVGLPKSGSKKLRVGSSTEQHSLLGLSQTSNSYPRSVVPLALDVLRIAVIMFCTAALIARCFISFGGKFSIVYYVAAQPILWAVRWHVLLFHLLFILVELDVPIPLIVPRNTLDNFAHKGFMMSFIGLVDLCMNSNRSLVDIVDELQGEVDGITPMSQRSVWMRCSFAVLGVSSRGLMTAGPCYTILGLFSFSGETRREYAKGKVGVPKGKRASI